jgi:hypothetical protein
MPVRPPAPNSPRGQWIDGAEWRRGVAGPEHPHPQGPRRHLRAGPAECAAAEAAVCRLPAPSFAELELAAEAWLEDLLGDDAWLDELALELGLPAATLEPELDRLEALEFSAMPAPLAPQPGQALLYLAHWSQGAAGLIEALLPLWLAGWPVILSGDGRLPGLVHRLGRAAAEHLGPRFAALPAPDPAALCAAPWRSALACGRVGSAEQRIQLIRSSASAGLRIGPLETHGAGSVRLPAGADPAAAARRWLGACLDAYPAFGGQGHDLPTWAQVPARDYADFCEAAHALLEAGYAQPLLAPIDGGAERRLQTAVQTGLESGGVLISGPSGPAEIGWRPALFVNCEQSSALVLRREPLPVLCLSRA